MALNTPDLSVEITVSNMCFGLLERHGVPTWKSNLDQLKSFLEETGYRNFEIHPTQAIVEEVHARYLSGDTDVVDEVVGSLHQTFNDGKGPYGVAADIYRVQRRWVSVGGMFVIQRALSRPVPSVHYPDWRGIHIPALPRQDLPGYPGSFPVVQPKPELYRDFSIEDPKDFMVAMGKLGMLGLCPDTVHSRERAKARKHEKEGTPSPPWREVWASQFASGQVYQMHVSADRADLKGQDPKLALKSRQEFRAFTRGDWVDVENTDLSSMIIQGIENWVPPQPLLRAVGAPVLRMVVEIPPWLRALPRRVDKHRRVVETLVEIIKQTGATPLLWGDPTPSAPAKV